ncbi:MAG: DUF6350 family protein [Arcanobacterium sp.]|nr:DUF6350 family protein [Arcanobacterium sp.]
MNSLRIDSQRILQLLRATSQAMLLPLLGIVLLCVFFYAINASSPLLGNIVWADSIAFGVKLWIATFGGTISIAEMSYSLVPTTFLIIMIWLLNRGLRFNRIVTWLEAVVVAGFSALIVALAGVLISETGPWWVAIIGGALVGFLTAVWNGRETLVSPKLSKISIHHDVRENILPTLRLMVLALFSAAILLLIIASIFHTSAIVNVHKMYHQGILGNIGLVLVQILYLPTFIVWVASWLLGAGVNLGGVAATSVFGTEFTALPGIPMLAIIPENGFAAPYLLAFPILLGGLAGFWVVKRQGDSAISRQNAVAAWCISSVLFFVLLSAIALSISGGIGAGALANIAVNPHFFGGLALLLISVPMLLVQLFIHPDTWKNRGNKSAKSSRVYLKKSHKEDASSEESLDSSPEVMKEESAESTSAEALEPLAVTSELSVEASDSLTEVSEPLLKTTEENL